MIVSIDEIMSLSEFSGQNAAVMQNKLDALEILIRKYTNNNFQNRNVRFSAATLNDRILGYHSFLEVGDTVQISESGVNDGLYVITEVDDDEEFIRVNKSMFTVDENLVTKVEYPFDIKQGVIKLLQWDVESQGRLGVKSETISRHSVTYFDQDKTNQLMGYPVSLMAFLEIYKKARF